jgi:hypothetical protein
MPSLLIAVEEAFSKVKWNENGGVTRVGEFESRRVAGATPEAMAKRGGQEWRAQSRSEEEMVHIQEREASTCESQGHSKSQTKEEPREQSPA